MRLEIFKYILVMALTVYAVRLIPLLLFRKEIKSKYLKRFFHYLPYAVISAMTFPAVFYSTGSLPTACIGIGIAVVLSYFKQPFILITLASCVAVYLAGFLPI